MMVNLYVRRKAPFLIYEFSLQNASPKQLANLSNELGIALNLEEMERVKRYFIKRHRNPTDVELQTIGQTWSEHCCHKTFQGKILIDGKEIDSLFKTYISRVVEHVKPKWCFSVFEDNAGIVNFDDEYGVAIKVETHNHPSAVEPFGGAATGTGGVIRDVLGVWADPIACTDVLGFGPLDFDYRKLPFGVKHPKYLYMGVIAGIGSYGNNMGIPTVNGAVYFDESYVGNVVVYCGCVGLLPLRKFKKNARPNDVIVLAGGKTGRDGIHGVTFASAELTEKSEEISRPAVQIANPYEEEKLKRAIIEIRDTGLASSITDLGGGGLSSAIGETANRFGTGARIELDKVPLKYEGLTPWEIYVSESQERMLLAIPAENLQRALRIFEREDVQATAIGKLTSKKTLELRYANQKVADVDIDFLFRSPAISRTAIFETVDLEEPHFTESAHLDEILFRLLASPNIASKEGVVRRYDHEVKGNTALKPFQGERAGPNDAAVLKPLNGSWRGIVISCGMNPNYGKIDTYWMAASTIDEAIRNNIAAGGKRIALLDNFTWGNPERPERLGSLVKACEACYDFGLAYRTPFISGKDSLYNESPMGPITPTLLITALGMISDVRRSVSVDLKSPKDLIYILGSTLNELGGSEYYRLRGFLGKNVPRIRKVEAKRTFSCLTKAIDSGLIKACHDLSEGGLAVALSEMAFASDYGVEIDLDRVPKEKVTEDEMVLFSESNSRFLVEISSKAKNEFEGLMKGAVFSCMGKVTESSNLCIHGLAGKTVIDVSTNDLMRSWKQTLRAEV